MEPFLRSLAKLRPSQAVLQALGIELQSPSNPALSLDAGQALLSQFVRVLVALGRMRAIEPEAVPTCVTLLLAIGLDAASTLDARLDVMSAVETLCNAYCSEARGQVVSGFPSSFTEETLMVRT